MKKILCYGDSNVFGYAPKDGTRYDENTRWTGILSKYFDVIEEGCCNRTGFVNNPQGYLYSAQRHFPKLISKAAPVDILILAVGTNDLQFLYDTGFKEIERGLETLINLARGNAKEIILIPPVILDESVLKGAFVTQFDETSISKSKKVGRVYKKLAQIYGYKIFDINEFVKPSDLDGLHYDAEGHKLIAEKLKIFIDKL